MTERNSTDEVSAAAFLQAVPPSQAHECKRNREEEQPNCTSSQGLTSPHSASFVNKLSSSLHKIIPLQDQDPSYQRTPPTQQVWSLSGLQWLGLLLWGALIFIDQGEFSHGKGQQCADLCIICCNSIEEMTQGKPFGSGFWTEIFVQNWRKGVSPPSLQH